MGNREYHRPPRLARWLLVRVFQDSDDRTVAGDFDEVFRTIAEEQSLFRARLWYYIQIIISIKDIAVGKWIWSVVMCKNYLTVALRNIKKHKAFSFINIAGLSVGLACCVLILLWVQDEISYDQFHENASTIYRLTEELRFTDGTVEHYGISADSLGLWLQMEYPEIINSTRVFQGERVLVKWGIHHFYEEAVVMVDPAFLEVFSFPFLRGDPDVALREPYSIVITESISDKYFGSVDAVGKILRIEGEGDFQVTGILKDILRQSHLQFDMLVPVKARRRLGIPSSQVLLPFTYLQLDNVADARDVQIKIRDAFPRFAYSPAEVKLALQPLLRIHLYSKFDWDMAGHGDITHIKIFSLIAVFVLVIACINFMNLSTARSVDRAREVGMRKVLGAVRWQLIRQFYGESVLLCGLALCLALFLVSQLLPLFNQLANKALSLHLLLDWRIVCGIIAITGLTSLVSSSYPAFLLSGFEPVKVLKGRLGSGKMSPSFRRILVIFQFTLSITLICGTIIVSRQIHFMRNRKLGFDKNRIIYVSVKNLASQRIVAFKEAVSNYSRVTAVTVVSEVPTRIERATDALYWEGKKEDDNILMRMFRVDYHTCDVFRFKLTKGRFFSPEFQTDIEEAYVLNQAAVSALGFTDPVGKRFTMWGREGRIIGVVENFHFQSLHRRIEPLIMHLFLDWNNYICIKMRGGEPIQSIQSLAALWKSVFPDHPFMVHFLDQTYARLYANEQRTGSLFLYFTLMAILISCLGLFGLTSFMTEQRTKEVGIRKVLGATALEIVLLLSMEFIKWISMANLFGWLIAWYAMDRWLENFAYRVNIGLWTFIFSAVLALVVAIMTVSYQTFRAARANPVESLRYE